MLLGINRDDITEYSVANDTDNPTVFVIGTILHKDKLRLLMEAMDKQGGIDLSKLQDKTLDIVKAGVKCVKNFEGKDYNTIDDDLLERIPLKIVLELMSKVIEFNFLREGEEKNS